MIKYNRNLEELEDRACKWWPENLIAIEKESSIIPILIETQDRFISILTLASQENPLGVFGIISASKFPANLFIKHLMIFKRLWKRAIATYKS